MLYAYLRVSTDDQSNGLEAQRVQIETYARLNKQTVAEWFTDRGVSGTASVAEREGLALALNALTEGDTLVVAKRDRLARDTMIALLIEREVTRCKANLRSADGVGNGDTPADAMIRAILDAVAQFERSMISARTKAALQAKIARGERVGRPRYGWTVAEGNLTEVPEEQEKIAEVKKLRIQGLRYGTIAARLRMDHHTVRKMCNENG